MDPLDDHDSQPPTTSNNVSNSDRRKTAPPSSSIWKRVSQQELGHLIASLVAAQRKPAEDYLRSRPSSTTENKSLRVHENSDAHSLLSGHSPLSRLSRSTSRASSRFKFSDAVAEHGDRRASATPTPRDFVDSTRQRLLRSRPSSGGFISFIDTHSSNGISSGSDSDTPESIHGHYHQPYNPKDVTDRPQTPLAMAPSNELLSPTVQEEKRAGPDLSPRGIHIPSRTSSKPFKVFDRMMPGRRRKKNPSPSVASTTERTRASSAASMVSLETPASSIEPPALQDKGPSELHERLEPLVEDDPHSFDLLANSDEVETKRFSLEDRSDLLFSREHLKAIFQDPHLLHGFTAFLTTTRPRSIPVLIYYLDALKAIRAINYSNAVAEALEPLEGFDFTEHAARPTINAVLEEKADAAFDVLVRDDLPAYITYVYIRVASQAIAKKVTASMPDHVPSEGLAEVFCLTDVSRPDNPIIFASEEFHRTTQYGVSYAIGRNCRFLQGPRTNPNSIKRIRTAVQQGKEISEVFLNYRRDGSPFMNLLTMAPLHDSRGTLRYFIGAQIDISGLVKDCTDLEGLQKVVSREEGTSPVEEAEKDEFQELAEMLNDTELDSARKHGGRMHRDDDYESDNENRIRTKLRPRMLLRDSGDESTPSQPIPDTVYGRLEGVYQNYLLLRPAPSLRILFTSPSLRIPGILQSPFLDRIGGSTRVRSSLTAALAEGQGVTAKVKWLTNPRNSDDEGRTRWVHATPLLDANGRVGVWMVLLIDEESEPRTPRRIPRSAPPVESSSVLNQRPEPKTSRRVSRNVPETDSIIMRSIPSAADSSADEHPYTDNDDAAPSPRVRTVPRNQPRLVSGSNRSKSAGSSRFGSPGPSKQRGRKGDSSSVGSRVKNGSVDSVAL